MLQVRHVRAFCINCHCGAHCQYISRRKVTGLASLVADDRNTRPTHRTSPTMANRIAARTASLLPTARRRPLVYLLFGCAIGFAASSLLRRARLQVGLNEFETTHIFAPVHLCVSTDRSAEIVVHRHTSQKLQPVPTVVFSASVDEDPFLGNQQTFEEPGRLSSCAHGQSPDLAQHLLR